MLPTPLSLSCQGFHHTQLDTRGPVGHGGVTANGGFRQTGGSPTLVPELRSRGKRLRLEVSVAGMPVALHGSINSVPHICIY